METKTAKQLANERYRQNHKEYYNEYYKEYYKKHPRKNYTKIYKERLDKLKEYIILFKDDLRGFDYKIMINIIEGVDDIENNN